MRGHHRPGFMDTMSDQTSSNFAEAIEWVSEQPWCSGRVGLLGISYYAGSQWRVAARRPKGLACVIPWEGMHDYYRDRVRPGGILSNGFINFWQNRQINTNQFGVPERSGDKRDANLPGMSPRPANEEGTLSEEQLRENRTDQTVDTLRNKFMDDPYFASREYRLSDIKVPMLSVANWGGICLHLRGNVLGYLGAASPLKWLYFITGRHDLPFYLPEWTALQKSFFDAFLKDEDDRNWKGGPNAANGVPAITYCNRKGNPGFNKTSAERTYGFKQASAWPLPNTSYETLHLSPKGLLEAQDQTVEEQVRWSGLTGESVRFSTQPFAEEREVTGHPVLHVTLSVAGDQEANIPSDLDLFVTLRHIDPQGQEVMYTGTAGDPVPLTKGWLRLSMRKLAGDSLPYLPKRNYLSSEVQPLKAGERYSATVELWPTNVTVEKDGKLVLEVGPKDQQGCGIFVHNHPEDRPKDVFAGVNVLHTGPGLSDLVLPFVK